MWRRNNATYLPTLLRYAALPVAGTVWSLKADLPAGVQVSREHLHRTSLLLGQVDLQVFQIQQQAVSAEQHAVPRRSHRGRDFARRLDFAQCEKRRVILDGLTKQLSALGLACKRGAAFE